MRAAVALLAVIGAAERVDAGSVVIEERAIDLIDDTAPEPATATQKPPPDEIPYRFAVMMSDTAALGLTAAGYKVLRAYEDCECEEFASGYLMMFGVSAYVAGPPAIHYSRGHIGRTVASAATRVGFPAAAFGLAAGLDLDTRDTAVAVGTSVVIAMAFDWLLLARD